MKESEASHMYSKAKRKDYIYRVSRSIIHQHYPRKKRRSTQIQETHIYKYWTGKIGATLNAQTLNAQSKLPRHPTRLISHRPGLQGSQVSGRAARQTIIINPKRQRGVHHHAQPLPSETRFAPPPTSLHYRLSLLSLQRAVECGHLFYFLPTIPPTNQPIIRPHR